MSGETRDRAPRWRWGSPPPQGSSLLSELCCLEPSSLNRPIRPTREHIAISPHGGLYAMPYPFALIDVSPWPLGPEIPQSLQQDCFRCLLEDQRCLLVRQYRCLLVRVSESLPSILPEGRAGTKIRLLSWLERCFANSVEIQSPRPSPTTKRTKSNPKGNPAGVAADEYL